ncbi:MAG: anthranilate synthase component I family protein [Nocardioides sp.]
MSDPSSFFAEIAAAHRRCFWLDGGGARDWSAKRSMIGWLDEDDVSLTYHAADREVRRHADGRVEVVGDDIFVALEREMAEGRAAASGPAEDHWVGYFGYAARPDLPALTGPGLTGPGLSGSGLSGSGLTGSGLSGSGLPGARPTGAGPVGATPPEPLMVLPDAVWMRPRGVRFFEHSPVAAAALDTPATGLGTPLGVPHDYVFGFTSVQENLTAGNSYEANLTYRQTAVSALNPVTAYLRLRDLNPAPYAGFLQHDVPGHRGWLLSSSPERYAVVTEQRMIETKPIKGTTARGTSAKGDEASRRRLANDPKYRAENLMIVDLLRNDLSMVCQLGTVSVPELMSVESYPSVHQLVSSVRGRLRPEVSTVSALRALFPAGSMTGAPKRRTMEIIADVEVTPRGPYAGAFGWICADGRADLGVIIRTLVTDGSGRYDLGTGGGITVDSNVVDEYAESRWKADRLLRVFAEEPATGR